MNVRSLRAFSLPLLCSVVLAAPVGAAEGNQLHIPAGDLALALQALVQQSGAELVYRAGLIEGLQTRGVHGKISAEEAVRKLLRGTSLIVRTDQSGAILITAPSRHGDPSPTERSTTPMAALEQAPTAHFIRIADVAQAQTTPNQTSDEVPAPEGQPAALGEVVVTGTQIRGIAPVGANVISVDTSAIAAASPTGGDNLLNNTIPQLSEFNNTNINISAVNTQVTVDRPNLRNLPGLGTAGDSTTLVLLDGHRLVGDGLTETAPDADMIPPSLIERIEVIPDGGSAIYGSDAVGGVINFITKRQFDGVQVDGHAGFASDYHYYDATGTVGHDWSGGSAYAAYSYNDHSPLFGYDRDYVRHYSAGGGPAADLNCIPGNVVIASGAAAGTYALPGLQPNTANDCDTSKDSSFVNRQQRNSVFAGVSQDLNQGLKLDVRVYYTDQIQNNYGDFVSSSAITAANPYYMRVASNPAPAAAVPETVYYNWGPALGFDTSRSQTELESWGVTPTVTWDIGQSGWEIREMTNYGGSQTSVDNPGLNPAAQSAALASANPQTALDPYNIAQTNPAVLANIANYEFYGHSHQQLLNERIVGDGGLFALPGGEVHFAAGSEYIDEHYKAKEGNFVPGTEGSVPYAIASRYSVAGFWELAIPIFSDKNAVPGIAALSFSSAGRYDHYSDFGNTFNPQFAMTWAPVDWVKVRGKWGTSFIAPSLADTNAINNSLLVIPAFIFPDVLPGKFTPNQSLWNLVVLQGGLPNLKPQTAQTWEIGTDILPPIVPDFKLSVTYYHIFFTDIVSTPDVSNPFDFFTNYTQSYTLNPTEAQVNALAAQVAGGLAQVAPLFAPGALPVYAIYDARRQNLGNAVTSGLDLGLNYRHKTGFGSVDASFNGTYTLESYVAATPTSAYSNELTLNTSRFQFIANAGANIGAFRTQAIVTYNQGFGVTPTSVNGFQSHVGSFTVTDLFFLYNLSQFRIGGTGLSNNLLVTLAINNLFNVDPPAYRGAYNSIYNGYANGATVGRLFQMGLSKKF